MLRCLMIILCLLLGGTGRAQAGPLRIYFIDVEGGQATLVVSPSGQTLLIDAGWEDERDARRITQTMRAAGIKAIDFLLVTHFHRDHAGGVANLAKLIPIRAVFDHGENTESYRGSAELVAGYRAAIAKAHHTVVRPGDRIPLRGVDVTVIASGGKWIAAPLPGAGAPNAACGSESRKPDEHSENEASIGVLLQFGQFRMLDLADLLWNQELDLMCPINPIGAADLLVVSHHGKDTSNSATLIRAVHPKVAILNNADKKGGSPATFDILRASPGFADLWQLHRSAEAGDRNSGPNFLANPGECKAFGIEVSATSDGAFQVTNQGNDYRKEYRAGK